MVRKKISYFIFLCLLAGALYFDRGWTEYIASSATQLPNDDVTMKQDVLCLMMAYPEYVVGVEKNDDGNIYVVMKSGRRILYDDKKVKNHAQKLSNPDLQDMLEQRYPLSDSTGIMPVDFDPGRARVYPLLKEVYGGTKEEIQKNLVNVGLAAGSSQFNKNNHAAASLKKVMQELKALMQNNTKISGFVYPMSGTFNYRVIAGTNQLSPHSFGIAIDLARDKRDYWKWASREQGEKRLASYSRELVQIFENNGFIWGGKWGHFDILHFEYRPEFIIKAKYFGTKPDMGKQWYEGVPVENNEVKNYIQAIDKAFE
ncbi:M15 family metallopeptidase [Petroclostridium sp. X23]|uniref:M15 family metallopeptidase n=1 Tax=Petroclostridium sp. X23 TaxID=3045146 RepID=UPI0024ADDEC2|nr:M15 family metallopeptidase [Petroclostridium sp. X23]WHH60868.1 M15 family metallopeptidase [Petroclostridium sp. X23]